MADEKKGGGEGEGGGIMSFADTVFWLLLLATAWYVIKYLFNLVGVTFSNLPSLTAVFSATFDVLQIVAVFLSLVFLLGFIYFNFMLGQLLHHAHGHGHGGHGHDAHGHGEHAHDSHATGHGTSTTKHTAPHSNKRFEQITSRMASLNEADWRLAIIECDILLNEMLIKMGYHGESIADKLKLVEKSDFTTIDLAWEAHKIRNRIAHSGSEFHLSRSDAERTFELYKKVFEEFYFI